MSRPHPQRISGMHHRKTIRVCQHADRAHRACQHETQRSAPVHECRGSMRAQQGTVAAAGPSRADHCDSANSSH